MNYNYFQTLIGGGKKSIDNLYHSSKGQVFIRFCIVGVIATLIDATIFYLVNDIASYQIALISGYIISLIANYFMTVLWTFKVRPTARNALGVLLAHLFNLFIVRMSLMFLFVDVMLINEKLAYIPTLLISMITNFLVVRLVVRSV